MEKMQNAQALDLQSTEPDLRLVPPCFGRYSRTDVECRDHCDMRAECVGYQVEHFFPLASAAVVYQLRQAEEAAENLTPIPWSKPQTDPKGKNPLKGKSFCFTGQIDIIENGKVVSRDRLGELIASLGARFEAAITKSRPVDFLVQSEAIQKSGTKTAKQLHAEEQGVQIISEKLFLEMYKTAMKEEECPF